MKLAEEPARWMTRQRALHQWSRRRAAAESSMSVGVWQRLETGGDVEYRSLVRAVSALGWPPATADELAAGRVPGDEPDPGPPIATANDQDDPVGLAALAGELSPEGRAKVEGYIRAVLEQEGK